MNEQLKKLTAEIKEQMLAALKGEEVQNAIAETKAAADGGTFEVIISTADVDRAGESVSQDGWNLDNYKSNPVVLWAHNYSQLPIGVCDEISLQGGKLVAKGRFALHAFAQDVRSLYDQKIVRATSVGFIPGDMEGNVIKTAELLEFSFVPVPANPYALSLAKSGELNVEEFVTKGILIKEGVADELDKNEERKNKWANVEKFEQIIYAFYDVYFSEETTSDQFQPLLKETIGLLSELTGEAKATEAKIFGAKVDIKAVIKEIAAQHELKALSAEEMAQSIGKIISEMQTACDSAMTGAGQSLMELIKGEQKEEKSEEDKDDIKPTGEENKVNTEAEEEEEPEAQKGTELNTDALAAKVAAAVAEILQGGAGENIPKQKSNNSGCEEIKELDSFLDARQVLRSVDNVVNAGLERMNKVIREGSKK